MGFHNRVTTGIRLLGFDLPPDGHGRTLCQ
jgi:hypothetical protein